MGSGFIDRGFSKIRFECTVPSFPPREFPSFPLEFPPKILSELGLEK